MFGETFRKNITVWLFLTVFSLAGLSLTGCRSDILGLVRSTSLDERLKEQDNFHFLQAEDMTLSLGEEYSFIVLGDMHIENDKTYGLEKIKDVIAADSSIKFAVFTGDITQNGNRQDIETFIDIARSFGIPCYPVIGNHDIYFNNWQHWKTLIGSTRYRINGTGTTLFILDSANAYFGKAQLDWLEREIKNTQGYVFVFTHSNLFTVNPVIIQQLTDTRERARISSILSGRCNIMFIGHMHMGSEKKTGNVLYINVQGFRNNQTYYLVSVTKNGIKGRYEKLNY